MSNHNHTGTIWSNANNVNRHVSPDSGSLIQDRLQAGTPLIVLCYSKGDELQFVSPEGSQRSDAWDFVVTDDHDSGGYVNDVYIDTGGDIREQQGTCTRLIQTMKGPSAIGGLG